MTKNFPSRSDFELDDERPRICGGGVFLKLMKKGKCGPSLAKNDETPFLTSSSSSSSSLSGDTFSKYMYDAANPQYCMPRQIEGVGMADRIEHRDNSKLNFNLTPQIPNNDYRNVKRDHVLTESSFSSKHTQPLRIEDSVISQSIVRFKPLLINELKEKHIELSNQRNHPERPSRFELGPFTPSVRDEAEDIEGHENVDPLCTEMEPSSERSESQHQHRSKVRVMREEISSFRKELDAVKKSLPQNLRATAHRNEADTTFQSMDHTHDDITVATENSEACSKQGHWVETGVFNPREPDQEAATGNVVNPKESSDENDVWKKIDNMFALKEEDNDTFYGIHLNADDVWKEPSMSIASREQSVTGGEESVTEVSECPSEATETPSDEELGNPEEEQKTTDSSDSQVTIELPTEEVFTEELPTEEVFTEELPTEEVFTEEVCTEEVPTEEVLLEVPTKEENIRTEGDRLRRIHKYLLEQERPESEIGSVEFSNYRQDLELVQKLLKKYSEQHGEKTDSIDKRKKRDSIDKAKKKHDHYAIDAPTDAWFHRHAAGLHKASEKSSKDARPQPRASDQTPGTIDQKNECAETSSTPPAPVSTETKTQTSPESVKSFSSRKTINRVRFAEETGVARPMRSRGTSDRSMRSPGKLKAKIQFWETNEKMRNMPL